MVQEKSISNRIPYILQHLDMSQEFVHFGQKIRAVALRPVSPLKI